MKEPLNSSASSQQDMTSETATTIPETTATETTANIETTNLINARHPLQIDQVSKSSSSLRSAGSPLIKASDPLDRQNHSTAKPVCQSVF